MVKSWVFGNLSCAQYVTHVRRTDSVSAYCHAGREKNQLVDHMRQIPFIHTVPFTSYVKINFYLNIDYGKVSFPWWRLGVFLRCSFDSYKLPWYKISNLHWKLFRIVLWKSGFFFHPPSSCEWLLLAKSTGFQEEEEWKWSGKRKSDDISPFGLKWAEIEQKYPLQKKAKWRCLKYVEYRKEVSQWMLVLSYSVACTFWDLQKKKIIMPEAQ